MRKRPGVAALTADTSVLADEREAAAGTALAVALPSYRVDTIDCHSWRSPAAVGSVRVSWARRRDSSRYLLPAGGMGTL